MLTDPRKHFGCCNASRIHAAGSRLLLAIAGPVCVAFGIGVAAPGFAWANGAEPLSALEDTPIPPAMQVCAQCHRGIVESFLDHGMASSVGPMSEIAEGSLTNPGNGQRYEISLDDDGALLSATFPDGGERQQRLVGRIGAGKLTTSWVGTEVDPLSGMVTGRLFFAPLETVPGHGLSLAPFELQAPAGSFGFPLTDDCLSCHTPDRSGTLQGAATRVGDGPNDPFPRNHLGPDAFEHLSPFTCGTCHGDVSTHPDVIRGRIQAEPGEVGLRRIGDLKPSAQRDICSRCHLQGDARIDLVEGKVDHDLPIAGQIPVLTTRKPTDDFRFVGQMERLALSACFLGSPQMTCTTCHRPHQGVAEQGTARFDATCRNCHRELETPHTTLTAAQIAGDPARTGAGCVDCHVRRSQPFDLPHVRSADHFIRRRIAPPAEQITHRQFGDRDGEMILFTADKRLEQALASEAGQRWRDGVMAMGLASMGRFDEARARFAKFPAPGSPEALTPTAPSGLLAIESKVSFHSLRASLLMAAGELQAAKAAYSDALKLDPRNPLALLARARLNLDTGDLNGALVDSQAVIDSYPSAEQPWELRLEIAERHNRPDLALAALNATTRIWPSNAAHWLKKAILLRQQGEIEASDMALRQVRRLQPALLEQVPAAIRGE